MYEKLQLYRQTNEALHRTLKRSTKYYGPFEALACIGTYAYQLQPDSKVIQFFMSPNGIDNRRHIIKHTQVPFVGHDGLFLMELVAILARRVAPRKNMALTQVFVQWSHTSPDDATWDD